jgi:peptidoglycan hydrolase-like amidase
MAVLPWSVHAPRRGRVRLALRLLLAGPLLAACAGSVAREIVWPAPDAPEERSPGGSAEPPGAGDDAAQPRRLPDLAREPLLQVFLACAPRVALELEERARLEAPGLSTWVGPGPVTLEALGGAWRIAGTTPAIRGAGLLASGGRPIFALDAQPEFGAPRRVRLAGDLVLRPEQGAVEVVERIAMEDYVARVVTAEMNPSWPESALAAQAIVARSYAAARFLERFDQPWQLHWHFGVDMAYHGWSASSEQVARAIAPTRGEMLVFRGFPVLALFHASSGGRTESFERIKPGVFAPDGKTSIAAAMPVVEDDAALPGAAGLELSASHGLWKTDIPLPEVTRALQEWSRAARGRPPIGAVEALSVAERYADSGRVARVSVRHRLDGAERFTTLAATDFRMAVSPVRIRSLYWDRCVIAARAPGYLVLEGRGFGHGCGLSQVSAWHLARQGASPEEIVQRFYAGARIERRY